MKQLTIGQLAKRAGMRSSALRYYEEQGLLTPAGRSPAGYRLYDPEAEQVLHFIRRAQRLGISLSEIKVLLDGWQTGRISDQVILDLAESRYMANERQLTEILVRQHELALFLNDLQQQAGDKDAQSGVRVLEDMVEHSCAGVHDLPAETALDWLVERAGCMLSTRQGHEILDRLRGQAVHVWLEEDAYHILVDSEDPAVGKALHELARLEAQCQAHPRALAVPELSQGQTGYLLVARGDNAFLFARLFLALEGEGL